MIEFNWSFDKYFLVRNPVVHLYFFTLINEIHQIFNCSNLFFHSFFFFFSRVTHVAFLFSFLTLVKETFCENFCLISLLAQRIKVHSGLWWSSISLQRYNQLIKHSTPKITISAGVFITIALVSKLHKETPHWYQSL